MMRADPRLMKDTEVCATLNNMIKQKKREGWDSNLQTSEDLISRSLEGKKVIRKSVHRKGPGTFLGIYQSENIKYASFDV